MLCMSCSCAHIAPSDVRPTCTASEPLPTGLAIKHWCSFPRHRNSPRTSHGNIRARRWQLLRNQVATHATQQAQEWAADDLEELQQQGNGVADQYQLPLLPVTLIDKVLNCSATQLWRVICEPDPVFQATMDRLAGNNDVQHGTWRQQDGSLVREEQYIKSLKKNSIGPTEAFCIDQQQCLHHSSTGFAVERKVYTPKVPFGGSFYNLVRWCAWTEKGSGKVRLQVSCDVVFTNRWLPAKGIITSSSTEGMVEFYNMWLQELHHHLDFPNSSSQSK